MTKQQAVEFFGSQYALARALNIKQPSVARWHDPLPYLRQLQIEMLTMGKLRADAGARPPVPQMASGGFHRKQMG